MNRAEVRWWLGLAAIALLGTACRVAAWGELANVWADGGVPRSDAREIEMLAWNVLDGIGFADVIGYWRHDAVRMPFFSVFLAGLYALFRESRVAAQVVLCALSVATCLGVAGVGRLAFGSRAVGLVAGLLTAVYIPYVVYSIPLVAESTFTFLFVLGVYLLLRATLERGRGFALASGASFALAALTRFTAFAAVPAVVVAALFVAAETGRTRRIVGRIVMPCLFAMALTFSPWVVRNALVLGAFFPGESGGIRQVWTGANPQSGDPIYGARSWREFFWRTADSSEIERASVLLRETRDFIANAPLRYVDASVGRAVHHLDPPRFPTSFAGDFLLGPGWAIQVWILSRLGYAGIVLALFRRFSAGFLLGGTFFSLVAFHAIAGEDPRYRVPAEWMWLLGAAYLLVMLARFGRESLLAPGARDERAEPVRGSLIDRYALGYPLLGLAALPFLALAIVAPLRRAALAEENAPSTPKPPVSEVFAIAKGQGHTAIQYPRLPVDWSGELSHFVVRPDGFLGGFSLKVGKRGLRVGEAHVVCRTAPTTRLEVPNGERRTEGTIVGTIVGAGALGEPVIEVTELRLGPAAPER